MTVRDVIDRYYDCANRGDWEQWLTLFSDDVVGDEQLAGHFAGIGVLRGAIDGIRSGYKVFQMHPQHSDIDDSPDVYVDPYAVALPSFTLAVKAAASPASAVTRPPHIARSPAARFRPTEPFAMSGRRQTRTTRCGVRAVSSAGPAS